MVHPTSRSVPVDPRASLCLPSNRGVAPSSLYGQTLRRATLETMAACPGLSLLSHPLTSLLGMLIIGAAIPALAHSEEVQRAPSPAVTRDARMLAKGVELLDKTDSENSVKGLRATPLRQIERVTPVDQGVVSWKEVETNRGEERSPQAYDAAAKSLRFGQGSTNALLTPVAELTKPILTKSTLPAPNRRTPLVAQGRGASILNNADKQSASAFATGTAQQRVQRREWRAESLHP